MTKETKAVKADAGEMLAVFEAYRQANDARLAEIETKGASDPLTDERLMRIDRRLEALSLKMARPEASAVADVETDERRDAWTRYLRTGDESGVARLDVKSLNTGTGSEGGHVAPPELDRLIEARLLAASPMRQIATVRQTSVRLERHECRPAGASLGEATEHVFTLAVSSRDGGLREARGALAALRAAVEGAAWTLPEGRIAHAHTVYSDAMRQADRRAFRGVIRFRIISEEAS